MTFRQRGYDMCHVDLVNCHRSECNAFTVIALSGLMAPFDKTIR